MSVIHRADGACRFSHVWDVQSGVLHHLDAATRWWRHRWVVSCHCCLWFSSLLTDCATRIMNLFATCTQCITYMHTYSTCTYTCISRVLCRCLQWEQVNDIELSDPDSWSVRHRWRCIHQPVSPRHHHLPTRHCACAGRQRHAVCLHSTASAVSSFISFYCRFPVSMAQYYLYGGCLSICSCDQYRKFCHFWWFI